MLSTICRHATAQVKRHRRAFTQSAATTVSASASSTVLQTVARRQAYFVPRNTNGNLPVYSDIRNGGGRYLVLIRNVEGNIGGLANDLSDTLLEGDSIERSKMKVRVNQGKHIVISGGLLKEDVVEWLKRKGF